MQQWTAGEMLGQAEGSIGSFMRKSVQSYYQGHDLSTAQDIRTAANDTEAAKIITAMRHGRWQDVAMVAGFSTVGVVMGGLIQNWLNNPKYMHVSPVALLGAVVAVAGLAAPIGVVGRATLVTGGATFATSAQAFGWKR